MTDVAEKEEEEELQLPCFGHVEVWKMLDRSLNRKVSKVFAQKRPDWPENCFEVDPHRSYRLIMYLCDKPEPKSQFLKVVARFSDSSRTGCGNHHGKCDPEVIMRSGIPHRDSPKPWKDMTDGEYFYEEAAVVELDVCFGSRCLECTSQGLMELNVYDDCDDTFMNIVVFFKVT